MVRKLKFNNYIKNQKRLKFENKKLREEICHLRGILGITGALDYYNGLVYIIKYCCNGEVIIPKHYLINRNESIEMTEHPLEHDIILRIKEINK